MADIGVKFDEPFDKQAEFFRSKLKNQVTTATWDVMLKESHDKAFTVAGAMKADLLADLAAAVDESILGGGSIGSFRQEFKDIVAKHGWNYNGDFNWRTHTIYMTNLRTSYAAGRLAQLYEAEYDYWLYKHSDIVANPRKQHKAWNGLTLPADDPWWKSHYPPNGWGCRCRVIGVRRPEDVKRYDGYMGAAPDSVIDPKTGAPEGIDRGWDYMPGETSDLVQGIKQKLGKLPKPLAEALEKDLQKVEQKKYWDSTTEAGQWHDAAFKNAPTSIKNTIKKVGDPDKILMTEKAHPHTVRHKYIEMDEQTKNLIGQTIWRHEYGHWVDHKLGKKSSFSSGEEFTEAMQQDGMILITQAGKVPTNELKKTIYLMNPIDLDKYVKDLASKAKLDYQVFNSWVKNSPISIFDIGTHARAFREAQLIESLRLRDGKTFLDAIELVERGKDGKIVSEKIDLTYDTGLADYSDLFSAATMKRVEGHFSHSADYYKARPEKGRQSESFANLFEIISSHKFGMIAAEHFTPKMLKSMKKVLK